MPFCLGVSSLLKSRQGARPACSSCTKWHSECVYDVENLAPTDSSIAEFSPPRHTVMNDVSDPMINSEYFSNFGWGSAEPLVLPRSLSSLGSPFDQWSDIRMSNSSRVPDTSSHSSQAPSETHSSAAKQPELSQMTSAAHTFFQHYHPLLPCIHRLSFLKRLQDVDWARKSPLALSVLAVGTSGSDSIITQSQHQMWTESAMRAYSEQVNSPIRRSKMSASLANMQAKAPRSTLQDLQAAVWITYLQYISRGVVPATMFLSQAYSVACLHGFNRIDDDRRPSHMSLALEGEVEEQECRATMWAFAILDRHINFLHGMHFVVNDRLFYVSHPADSYFLTFPGAAGSDVGGLLPLLWPRQIVGSC